MIRYRCSADADSYLFDSYLPQWLVTHTAWAAADNQPPEITSNIEGEDFYHADWRFSWGSNSKSVLMSNLVSYTQSYAPWHLIGYHECDHDQTDRQGCSWDDTYTNGTVPASVTL